MTLCEDFIGTYIRYKGSVFESLNFGSVTFIPSSLIKINNFETDEFIIPSTRNRKFNERENKSDKIYRERNGSKMISRERKWI